eukprot:m.21975 g.21975  ORF g.21975 m.21975 type:complete len:52 (+) comp33366_c0_seq1:324-479(+)
MWARKIVAINLGLTSIPQPLDVGVFAVVKRKFRETLSAYQIASNQLQVPIG